MKKEIWKDIEDYEGFYQVSNFAQVRGLDRTRWTGQTYSKVTGRVSAQSDNNGYKQVSLWKNNKGKMYKVHRLVARAFIGVCPTGYDCCHINGIKDDNRVENLKYGTRSENEMDKVGHGKDQRGIKHWNSKLTPKHITVIKQLYDLRISQQKIAELFGLTQQGVYDVLKGNTWGWLKND